jgi:Xaa-Pro aminopeptidase
MTERIELLRTRIEELEYDAYIATNEKNVKYLTGMPEPQEPVLMIIPDGNYILYVLSDGLGPAKLYTEDFCEVKATDTGIHWGAGKPSLDLFLNDLSKMNLERVGFDTLSAVDYLNLTNSAKNVKFIPDRGIMWALRTIKSEEEIRDLRKAARIVEEAHKTAVEVIKPGIREYEVAAEIEYTMRRLGSEDERHRTIVASGPRTTWGMGTGFTTDRKIGKDELVSIDTGAAINGYQSDCARAYVAGTPTAKQKEIYNLILQASDVALACVKPGVFAGDVDDAVREVFGEYEQYCIHETGHGIGLEHEPPALTKGSTDVLKENMVISLEPALYMEDFGGIIIETMTLITKDGAERMIPAPAPWD